MLQCLKPAALFGAVLAAGLAQAKPPGPPVDPRVNGQEQSPIEREFHEVVAVRVTSNFRPREAEKPAKPLPIAEWLEWLQRKYERGLTIPLGTVEVEN